jgi:hypothetical protein
LTNFILAEVPEVPELTIGKAEPLGRAQLISENPVLSRALRMSTTSDICSTNQGSIRLFAATASTPNPRRSASPTAKIRCGVGTSTSFHNSSSDSDMTEISPASPLRPKRPFSRLRNAF